jgi:hypothetical protein
MKDEAVNFGGSFVLITDANGHYETPKQLNREDLYSAYASVPGRVTSHTDWTSARSVTFADITLAPEREEE